MEREEESAEARAVPALFTTGTKDTESGTKLRAQLLPFPWENAASALLSGCGRIRARTHARTHGGGERKKQGCCAPGCGSRSGRWVARQKNKQQFKSEYPVDLGMFSPSFPC